MFGNDFPIFLHFVLAILHDQFFQIVPIIPKLVCVHGLLDYCQLFLGVLCFFGSECVFVLF